MITNTIGESEFNVIVLRRPTGKTGKDYWIQLKEIQLWIDNSNVLPDIVITISSDYTELNGETCTIDFTTKNIVNSSVNNLFNGSIGDSFDYGVNGSSDTAIVIFMSSFFKIKEIQSLILYNRGVTGTFAVERAIGLAFELYNTTTDPNLENPLILTEEITTATYIYRFDFPAISTYPSGSYVTTGNSTQYIVNSTDTLIYKVPVVVTSSELTTVVPPLNFVSNYSGLVVPDTNILKVDANGVGSLITTTGGSYTSSTNSWYFNNNNTVIINDKIFNGGELTISLMVYFNNLNTGPDAVLNGIMSFQDSNESYNSSNIIFLVANQSLRIDGFFGAFNFDTFLTIGEWIHIVIVFKVGSPIKAYKNKTLTQSNFNINSIPNKKFNFQKLGGWGFQNRSYQLNFNGYIKNVRFYNKELSQTEINNLYDLQVTNGVNDNTITYFPYYMVNFLRNNFVVTRATSEGGWTTTGSFSSSSDDRIKSHEVEILNASEPLLKLTPKIYDKHPFVRFPEDQEDNDLTNVEVVFKESGLIAQEVLRDVPELEHIVNLPQGTDGFYSLNYVGIIPYLIRSVKELNEKLKVLEASKV